MVKDVLLPFCHRDLVFGLFCQYARWEEPKTRITLEKQVLPSFRRHELVFGFANTRVGNYDGGTNPIMMGEQAG